MILRAAMAADAGAVAGLQNAAAVAGIGTFVAPGRQRRGIAAPLFAACRPACRAAVITARNAAIRALGGSASGWISRCSK